VYFGSKGLDQRGNIEFWSEWGLGQRVVSIGQMGLILKLGQIGLYGLILKLGQIGLYGFWNDSSPVQLTTGV